MRVVKSILLVAITLALAGCSGESSEAKRFAKLLTSRGRTLDSLSSQEASGMQQLRQWAGTQAMFGHGRADISGPLSPGQDQMDASREANRFSSQLAAFCQGLGPLVQELRTYDLKTPVIQTARSSLVQSLEGRLTLAQELQLLLQDYGRGIVNPNLRYDQRPASIDAIVNKTRDYRQPSNVVAQTIQDLRTKYSISDSDLQ